jgi:hypothetical protein
VSDGASKRRLISRAGAGEKQHPPNAPAASHDLAAKNFPREILNALDAGRFWYPQDITTSMCVRAGELGVEDIARELQRLANKLDFNSERALANDLLGLIRAMVARLNWVAKAGKLADAPRYHEDWPINYAPDASKGASKWEAAKKLYQKLECGKNAPIPRIAGRVSYENRWTELAEAGVRAALVAKLNASAWVDEKIKAATLTVHRVDEIQMKQGAWSAGFVGTKAEERMGRTKIECDYHLCRDGSVVAWPAWSEKSKSLPDSLKSDNWQRFLPVLTELVRIFLLQDEKRMHEYLKASVPKKMEYDEKKGWDAFIFDNFLMKKVKGALESLASRGTRKR